MRYKLITLFIALFFLAISVHAQTFTVDPNSVTLDVTQGSVTNVDFTIDNQGQNTLTLVATNNLDLIDNDGDEITLTFNIPDIGPGTQGTVTMNIDVDSRMDFESYSGTLTFADSTDPTETANIPLSITVTPDVCDFGVTGNDLQLDIEEPDNNDEFEIGEEVEIRVEVQNVGNDNIRTQVEAFLFNENREIASAASPTENIRDGRDEKFDLSLIVPIDSIDVDPDDEFTLYVKAFDDENEQLNCVQEEIEIEIELPNRKVIFDDSTRFFPTALACGETAVLDARLINVGENDVDVQITVKNRELGVSEQTSTFEIEGFESEEDNRASQQFQIAIPTTAAEKRYIFELEAKYNGAITTENVELLITQCGGQAFTRNGNLLQPITLRFLEPDITALPGVLQTIPIELSNNANALKTYRLQLVNVEDFISDIGSQNVLLNPGQTTTVFFEFTPRGDAIPGSYTATILVKDGLQTVASESTIIEIKEKILESQTGSISGFFSSLPLAFWIIINLAILALIALSFKIITVRK